MLSEQSAALRESATKLLQAGDYTGAVGKLQEALSLDSQDGKAHGLLGICQARLGDLNSALQSLNAAAQLQPADASARYNLANALFQANQLDNARAQAQQTLALNPDHENAKQLLARIDAAQPVAAPAQPPPPTLVDPVRRDLAGNPVETMPVNPTPFTPAAALQPSTATASWTPAPPMQPAPAQPVPAGGLQFNPASAAVHQVPPSAGLRFMRGVGWGILFGQWWTMWRTISLFMFNATRMTTETAIWYIVYLLIVDTFVGGLLGFIIGIANASVSAGAAIGAVVALLFFGAQALLFRSSSFMINVIFYFFIGRYIGASIAARVQRPVIK